MTLVVDFNCDMGESFGQYKLGCDEEVIKYITSANVACGFHAGDPQSMQYTVELAEKHGVAIGAHPAFPDLQGFGRRNMSVTPTEARNDVAYQIGALQAFTKSHRLQHVKPHGAMYNMAVNNTDLAKAINEAVLETDPGMIIIVLAGSIWANLAREMGLKVAEEAFADRALNADGTLVPRTQHGSIIHDLQEVVERSVQMVTEGKVKAITGEYVSIKADTLCLHGDTPGAVEMAKAVRSGLESSGVNITSLSEII
ncbi:LamB/YcsF family protein [SAR202 cluster bacterium AD-493-K16_JPT_193m]|nr:LamB/YcsF family protein [SAR202 cluster bacterium AD-493-K16_JPT_193m]